MSNPATQNKTIIEKYIGKISNVSVTAKYAPIGESDSPIPRTKWHKKVNLLV